MIPACDTLFMPFENGALAEKAQGRVLFSGARPHPYIRKWAGQSPVLVQSFKPYAEALEAEGFSVAAVPPGEGAFDAAFILTPKNQREAEHDLGLAHGLLRAGGLIAFAAANDAGGGRLDAMGKALGLAGQISLSKHKCRLVYGYKNAESATAQDWVQKGRRREIEGLGFLSQPGLFSWDRLDRGSALLLQHLPQDLSGRGADFGCGYGVLSRAALGQVAVQELICADADARALECCRLNVNEDPRAAFLWADLTKAQPALSRLDFIVMNPPFHEGKFEAASIGQGFILTAAQALRDGGRLIMVANNHLPYEAVLEGLFTGVRKRHEGGGFKIIEAVR